MEVSGRFFLLPINYSFPGKLLSVVTGAIKKEPIELKTSAPRCNLVQLEEEEAQVLTHEVSGNRKSTVSLLQLRTPRSLGVWPQSL